MTSPSQYLWDQNRDCDAIMSEFGIKPPSTQKSKECQSKHLLHRALIPFFHQYFRTLRKLSIALRIYRKRGQKSEDRSHYDSRGYSSANWVLVGSWIDLKKTVAKHHDSYNDQYHTTSHIRVPLFMNMERAIFVASPPPSDASAWICFASLNRRKSWYMGVISIATKKVTSPNTTIRKNIMIHRLLRMIVDKIYHWKVV